MVRQGNCLHFVHDFHVEVVRRNVVLVDDELLQVGNRKDGRAFENFRLEKLFVVAGELPVKNKQKGGKGNFNLLSRLSQIQVKELLVC